VVLGGCFFDAAYLRPAGQEGGDGGLDAAVTDDGSTRSDAASDDAGGGGGGHHVAIAVGLGYDFTCALTDAGTVFCWGNNKFGTLGNGTMFQSNVPVPVVGLPAGVTSLAVGAVGACALAKAGVFCWGDNAQGQLGDGTTDPHNTPVAVSGLPSDVVKLSKAGYQTCALTSAGAVLCWGWNKLGEIGDGTTTPRPTPVPVYGLSSGVTDIATGSEYSCALTGGGAVLCWDNPAGELGDGTTMGRTKPGPVMGLTSPVVAITAGSPTCALTNEGGVLCWGRNDSGQVGDGTAKERDSPVPVSGLSSDVTAISAAGGACACALRSTGAVLCWGFNEVGAVGDGTMIQRLVPTAVSGLASGVRSVVAGASEHNCALTTAGAILCWGADDHGQLGNGVAEPNALTPTPVVSFP
jgi:alpha-tubulin suppressor-like RCC1 family protein